MSDGQLADILTQSKTRDYIAPKGNLLINMVPLKPKEANISCMRGIQGSTKIYSDIKTDTNDLSGLLSCCTMFGAPRDSIVAKVYFIDVFGDDPSSLRKHFTRHLVDIASNSKGMIGLNVILPECLPTSMIRQALTDANLRDDGSLSSSPVLIHLLEFWRRNECKH